MRWPVVAAFAAMVASTAVPAAAVTFYGAPPFPPPPAETVHLSDFGGSSAGWGTTEATGTKFRFYAGEYLAFADGDETRVVAQDGALTFLQLNVITPHAGLSALAFTVGMSRPGSAYFFTHNEFGAFSAQGFQLDAGDHDFYVAAGPHEVMTQFTFATDYDSGDSMASVGALRATIERTFTVTPEPEGWALMILGFASAGAMLRRTRGRFAASGALAG